MKKVGRPTDYNDDIASQICGEIAMGLSLSKIVKVKGMPIAKTIYRWFIKYPEFRERYELAKTDSADVDVEKLDEIVEKLLNEELDPQIANAASSILKWAACHKKPNRWGDRQHIEHSGKVGLAGLSDDEITKKLNELRNEDD